MQATSWSIDYRRGQTRGHCRSLIDDDLDRSELVSGDEAALNLGPELELATTLAALSDRERRIVALLYGGTDLTGPEMARPTGLSLSNVQQIL